MSTLFSESNYTALYQWSLNDTEAFWDSQAKHFLDWVEPWDKVMQQDADNRVHAKWFAGGKINATYNCVDRHLEEYGDKVAIIWESDDSKEVRKVTYKKLHYEVCKFSNVLKNNNVKKV